MNDNTAVENKIQNLCLFIIMVLCGAILVLTYRIYTLESTNWGSLEHYDSMYDERQGHISMNQNGEVISYVDKNGIEFFLKTPVPANYFYNE